MGGSFEWNIEKADQNLKKHEVSFEEGVTVLSDPLAKTLPDPDHSSDEPRYIDLGRSETGRSW